MPSPKSSPNPVDQSGPKEYSKIKNIFFPLRNYTFDHGLNENEQTNEKFIGRTNIKKKLKLLLTQKDTSHGAYLVTGYRGMGKTSMVREVIKEINKSGKYLERFEFSLSQDEVKDIDLLKQVGWKLNDYIHTEIKPLRDKHRKDNPDKRASKRLGWIIFSILILNLFYNSTFVGSYVGHLSWGEFFIQLINNAFTNPFKHDSSGGYVFLYFGLLTSIIYYINLRIGEKEPNDLDDLFSRIIDKSSLLNKRLYSSLTQEKQDNFSEVNLGSHNPISYMTNKILEGGKSALGNKKDTIIFSVATPKEIEKYIVDILADLKKLRAEDAISLVPFVFIIDELDKVEPDYFFAPGDRESDKFIHHNDAPFHIPTKARMRQEAIAKLLANLKNFLNRAEAKFVFIGGRGMYDASLADIADRESFYSSIFHEVIYVESFFKDKLSSKAGVSQITEAYLCSLLMSNKKKKIDYNLKELIVEYSNRYSTSSFKNNKEQKVFKIIHTLQNFIIFLTYRSNGSPKKLIELIERYLVLENSISKKDGNFHLENNFDPTDKKENMYLKLSFRDQLEINLNANIYRPYLIINSKYLKSLGDKLLYSTAFLIDHILKFHKVAFSWRNLELIPDIILSNKDANFRQFYTDIMRFLLKQHLRKTVNAVFQYKFNSKIANEIRYLSKTSEFSSAAFNFTLDESYHLKSYYKKKLAAKYKEYQEISDLQQGEGYIHSIGYLHSILGDLHYYDEEYDDAIVHYTDSVQALRQRFIKNSKLLSHQFVLYTRNKLNLGLCLEKTRSYDKAYSVYRSLIIQLQSFQKKITSFSSSNDSIEDDLSPKWEMPFKRMQLFLRPHVALLNVIEKQRQDGITYDNLERNLQEYLRFLMLDVDKTVKLFPIGLGNKVIDYGNIIIGDSPKLKKDNKEQIQADENNKTGADKKRLTSLIADYYFSVGGMLFFKNQIFFRLLYRKGRKGDFVSAEIKKRITSNPDSYHPSHAAYLYYLHALITFNAPFHENIKEIKNGKKKIKSFVFVEENKTHSLLAHIQFATNYIDPNVYRILNSNQFEVLANLCAKLGDTILGSLNEDDLIIDTIDKTKEFIKVINLFTKERIDESSKSVVMNLKEKMNLNLVFILFRISYLFYMEAGKVYSANFQYKKLLYVLNDSCRQTMLIDKQSYNLLSDMEALVAEFRKENSNSADLSDKLNTLTKKFEELMSLPKEIKTKKTKEAEEKIREAKKALTESEQINNSDSNTKKTKSIDLIELINQAYNAVENAVEEVIIEQKPTFLTIIDEIASILLKKQVEITGVSNRAQLRKYREYTQEKEEYQNHIYQNLSTSPEVREIMILVESLKLKIDENHQTKLNVGPFGTVSSMFTRTLELKFQSDLELRNVRNIFGEGGAEGTESKWEENFKKDVEIFKLGEQTGIDKFNEILTDNYDKLIPSLANAYFCLIEVIRILNTYGVSYILTHSFLAAMNRRMGVVSFYIKQICELEKDEEMFKEIIKGQNRNQADDGKKLKLSEILDSLVGEDFIYNIDCYHYWDLAKLHYQNAVKLHTEGSVYKDFSHSMYTLDDDFNDNLTHFCAASERFRVNTQKIKRQIEQVEVFLKDSKLYNYKEY